ncbi:lipase [Nocardioides sp. zg-536]|uniref:Lipase n=1 Tax=Nocardioides faecalis TaxID=2803858 RepID=A0A938Y0P5_9ACTN|nr:lipase [Nocardioides faecalis]QVI58772.1 lipase [Nocardioides faecalis]
MADQPARPARPTSPPDQPARLARPTTPPSDADQPTPTGAARVARSDTLASVDEPSELRGSELEGLLRGQVEVERTERGLRPHRVPAWARTRCPDPQLLAVEVHPAGVRLAFRSAATWVELDVVALKRAYVGLDHRSDGRYELEVDGTVVATEIVPDGDTVEIDLATGTQDLRRGPVGTLRFTDLPAGEKEMRLWLPHNEATELVALRADAPIERAGAEGRRTWLHHGSSLSQGSDATRPTATWPVLAARKAGVELTNLGLGGSALLDPFVARTMRDLPTPDLISVKMGINLVNADLMRRRAFGSAVHGFLDTIRDGHPDTPLVLITPLHCPIHEHTPGPSAFDSEALAAGELRMIATGDPEQVLAGKLTLSVIREELAVVAARRQDPHLRLLDGLDLYGAADHDAHPMPDRLHLDEAGHALVGQRFADRVLASL